MAIKKSASSYSKEHSSILNGAFDKSISDEKFIKILDDADDLLCEFIIAKKHMEDNPLLSSGFFSMKLKMSRLYYKALDLRPQVIKKFSEREKKALLEVKKAVKEKNKAKKYAEKAAKKLIPKVTNDKKNATRTALDTSSRLSLGGNLSDIFDNDIFDEMDAISNIVQDDYLSE